MAHIFKPGDRAYWFEERKWITLQENDDARYPTKCSTGTFTLDGRYVDISAIALLPLNPYDASDPNNPVEFRYPFRLNGRPVKVGDKLYLSGLKKTAEVIYLSIVSDKKLCRVSSFSPIELSDKYFSWPDEVVTKKKVAKWAYPIIGLPGPLTVGFTEEMTEEEAKKKFGSGVLLIPGTEREVEGEE